jgi:superfamily II DNA/RNA helicase
VPETYVHRIGRTARAGADGVAISLCAGEEIAYLRDIEKLIRTSLPREDRRTPGQREGAAPQRQGHGHQGRPQGERSGRHGGGQGSGNAATGQASGHGHGSGNRSAQAAPGSGKRRRRRGGAGNAPRPEGARPESRSHGDGIQGVAFLHRDSRPRRQRHPQA